MTSTTLQQRSASVVIEQNAAAFATISRRKRRSDGRAFTPALTLLNLATWMYAMAAGAHSLV